MSSYATTTNWVNRVINASIVLFMSIHPSDSLGFPLHGEYIGTIYQYIFGGWRINPNMHALYWCLMSADWPGVNMVFLSWVCFYLCICMFGSWSYRFPFHGMMKTLIHITCITNNILTWTKKKGRKKKKEKKKKKKKHAFSYLYVCILINVNNRGKRKARVKKKGPPTSQ